MSSVSGALSVSSPMLNEGKRKEKHSGEAESAGTAAGRVVTERDYDRILFANPTRRLADKTQVFPLDPNDSVRTRLTHSMEVSNLCRSIGMKLVHEHRQQSVWRMILAIRPLAIKGKRPSAGGFGGYRLSMDGVDVDIWHAPDTWACRQGLVPYEGIHSLLQTTVLNWDAILMNWRSGNLIHVPEYFEELAQRRMRIVLEANPNPIGMLVRVLRHLLLKDAHFIEYETIHYLVRSTPRYGYAEVVQYERRSYGECVIGREVYEVFRKESVPLGSFAGGYSDIGRSLNVRQISWLAPAV